MAKGYWVVFYRNVSNPAAVAQYAKPAEAAILAGGGRFLARGTAVKAFEAGIKELGGRTSLIIYLIVSGVVPFRELQRVNERICLLHQLSAYKLSFNDAWVSSIRVISSGTKIALDHLRFL
jgi:hypothetical protein